MTSAIESAEITHVASETLFLGSPRGGKGFNRSCLSPEMHSLRVARINKEIEPIVTRFKAVFTPYFSIIVRNVFLHRRIKELTSYLRLTRKTEININSVTMHWSNNGTLR